MRINDDFSQITLVHGARLSWVSSPAAGVERRMLYRVGEEVARATSIVRYAPGSQFPRHTHRGGEEILVLSGTFQDEHAIYPAGCYFRNPPGTSHIPASPEGCTLFVRLWQFRHGDHVQLVRQPGEGQKVPPRPGASAATVLFADPSEEVRLEAWKADQAVNLHNPRGLELLLLEGSARLDNQVLRPQSWLRLPAGVDLSVQVGPQGAKVWFKDAPLAHPDMLQMV